MDIDDLVNFINEDTDSKKKKSKKKKQQQQQQEQPQPQTEETNKEQQPPQPKQEDTIKPPNKTNTNNTTTNTQSEWIRDNPYKDLIKYDSSIEITSSRFQDNSHLRLINNWNEVNETTSSSWKQTNYPTYSLDEQYSNNNELPIGSIIEYGEKGIWRSTSLEKKQLENDYTKQLINMRKSAECHRQIRKYAQTLLKPGIKLIDFCVKLETMLKFITNAEGTNYGQAFPTGCSLNNVAAHYTPNTGDNTVLDYNDVCKIDFGTHINGYIIDSAFTVAFNPIYDNLLMASKEATNAGIKAAGIDMRLGDIGAVIQEVIESYEIELNGKVHKIKPVKNLCGHTMLPYRVHGGKSVPNVKSDDMTKMEEGEMYAIETFASTGKGFVKETKNWSHYMKNPFATRNTKIKSEQPKALFRFIDKHFTTLAFCPRWIEEKGFNNYAKALKYLCNADLVEPYPPLADVEGSYVAQFEHSLMLRPTCKEVFSVGDDY